MLSVQQCLFGMVTRSMRHGKHFSENLLKLFLRTIIQNTGKLPKVQCWTERKYGNVICDWIVVSKSSTNRATRLSKTRHIKLLLDNKSLFKTGKQNADIAGGFENRYPMDFLITEPVFGIRHRSVDTETQSAYEQSTIVATEESIRKRDFQYCQSRAS